MRKFFAVAMGSVVALVGFAGAANASATIDLVWIDVTALDTNGNVICLKPAKRNCPQIGTTITGIIVSDSITLGVLVTAGPQSMQAAGVSVDYTGAIPKLSVSEFRRVTTILPLPLALPAFVGPLDDPHVDGWIQNVGAASGQPLAGVGLAPGQTAYLGTVTFHKDALINGTFEIAVGTNGPNGTDAILVNGLDVADTATFNSAFLVNVPEPGALSLLVMGLGGMLLAGRGRRS
jgi:hypothetical protein